LLKAEYANRNYVITENGNNGDHYQTSVNSVTADLENLRQLNADNPNQQQKLGGLELVIAEKSTVMAKITNFRQGKNMAEVKSIRPRGAFLTEDILRRLEEKKDEERRLLSE
jgi:CHASE3 domain sensor protein